jgi:D-alanyl-D-alanine carboxypeptidase
MVSRPTKSDTLLTATKDSINKEPTILGLKEGEQVSVLDLVRASIATSANDAASTLAIGSTKLLGLDPSDYLDLINQKAALMSMSDTHFVNPEGYDDPSQQTTILDLVKLIDHALGYKEIVSAAKSDMENIIQTNTHGFYYLPNWNGLLGVYEGVYGLKIARTEKAGYCTIVLSRRNNINIAVIISGAKTLQERDQTAADLLDFSFNLEKVKPLKITAAILKKKYQVWNDLSAKIKTELGIK